MSSNPPASQADVVALCRAVELQVAALAQVAAGLRAAVAHPPLAPADWHGPASDAYGALESRLRSQLAAAERAVSVTLQTSRIAFAELGR